MDEHLEKLKLQLERRRQITLKICSNQLDPEQGILLLFLVGLRGLSLDLWEKTSCHDNSEESIKIHNCFYALYRTQHHFLEEWDLLEFFEDPNF
ncbi:MAG: hypothetical protein WBA77_01145 [Microcoleaceae cyanobacterium]